MKTGCSGKILRISESQIYFETKFLSVRANLPYTVYLETHCTMLIMSGLNWGGVFVLLFDLLLKISLGRKTIKYVLHYWLVLPPPACATLQGRRNVKNLGGIKSIWWAYSATPFIGIEIMYFFQKLAGTSRHDPICSGGPVIAQGNAPSARALAAAHPIY